MKNENFGQQLKKLREQQKQTQETVANFLGISRSAYSHFENGRNQPDQEMLVQLADYYDVSIDYLLGRKPMNDWEVNEDMVELQDVLHSDLQIYFSGKELSYADKDKIDNVLKAIFNENI